MKNFTLPWTFCIGRSVIPEYPERNIVIEMAREAPGFGNSRSENSVQFKSHGGRD